MANIKIDSYITVKLNMPAILNKVENDQFGLFLAQTWKKLIKPYTPHREGIMENLVEYRPFEITYLSPYTHYMYEGIPYVDPVYKKGGFTSDGGITFWSRPGVKKIPSDRHFKYSRELNKQATDHWDKAAEQAGQKEKLIEAANKYLRKRN